MEDKLQGLGAFTSPPTLWLFQTMMRKIHNYTGSATVTLLFLLRKALIPNFGPNIQRFVVRLKGMSYENFLQLGS